MSKFDNELDAILYEMALEGADTKTYADGSSVTIVDYIAPEDEQFTDWTPQRLARLSAAQREKAKAIRAAIVTERSDGIVEVKTFESSDMACEYWQEIPDGDSED